MELLRALNATFFTDPGRKVARELVGSEEEAARFLFPIIKFAMDHHVQVADMMETIYKTGAEEPAAFEGLLDKIARRNVAVEINTSGYDHPAGESYPGGTLLRECRRRGIAVTLGSDAHRPAEVGRHFDRAVSLLRRAGFDSLTTFTGCSPNRPPTSQSRRLCLRSSTRSAATSRRVAVSPGRLTQMQPRLYARTSIPISTNDSALPRSATCWDGTTGTSSAASSPPSECHLTSTCSADESNRPEIDCSKEFH